MNTLGRMNTLPWPHNRIHSSPAKPTSSPERTCL